MENLLLSRRRFSLQNVPSSEEHGETALLPGYRFSVNNMIIRWPAEAKRKKNSSSGVPCPRYSDIGGVVQNGEEREKRNEKGENA